MGESCGTSPFPIPQLHSQQAAEIRRGEGAAMGTFPGGRGRDRAARDGDGGGSGGGAAASQAAGAESR